MAKVIINKAAFLPLNNKEIQPVNPKGNQPWIFISRTDAEAEAPIPWPLGVNSQLTGKEHWCWSLLRFLPIESVMLSNHSYIVFVVILPKDHLTSHSRMSGSRWVIPSWLFWSLRPFLYGSSVYFCHLFLISSASVMPLPFLSFFVPLLAWNVPLNLQCSWRDF